MKQPHIQLDESLNVRYAILPGDPRRAERIASHMSEVEDLGMNREYRSLVGAYRGARILAMSTGMGGVSTGIAVEELIHIFIVDELDLLNLMGGTETVKEVEERNGAFDCGKMRNKRKVHDFLHGRGSQHGKTGLAAAHDVAVIAKDRQGMRRERTGADMEHAGQELAGDLIHIRDHQQQALRRREGRRKRAGFQRAVDCARSTAFRLHLRDTDFLSEQIFAAVCRPIVSDLRHRRGGIDRRYIGKCICNMRCSGVAIDGHGFCHCFSFLLIWN